MSHEAMRAGVNGLGPGVHEATAREAEVSASSLMSPRGSEAARRSRERDARPQEG
jgi:hypothetical protein